MNDRREGARMTRSRFALAALLVATIATGGATRAEAGEYPVYACDPDHGSTNRSWTTVNTAAVTAYTNCLGSGSVESWNRGLVTRHAIVGTDPKATVPTGSASRFEFRAPAGATLSRINYAHTFCSRMGFHAGLIDLNGHWLHQAFMSSCGTLVPSPWTLSLAGLQGIRLTTVCEQGPCGVGSELHAWATLNWATVYVSDATKPSVSLAGGTIKRSGWQRGTQTAVVSAADNVGVQHLDAYLDGKSAGSREGRCDYTLAAPCSTPATQFAVESHLVADGAHQLILRATDSAGNVGESRYALNIDNTAPSSPLDTHVSGVEG